MAEIKHSFTGGKMNKDLDQRLVPKGQYRNAMNIQVMTTDDGGDGAGTGDAGTVQNLKGNTEVGTATGESLVTGFAQTDFKCVGSIEDEKEDSAYFLFTSGDFTDDDDVSTNTINKIDTIVRENVTTGVTTPVFVDKWGYQTTIDGVMWDSNSVPAGIINQLTVPLIASELRVNMTVEFYQSNDDSNSQTAKIKRIDGNTIIFYDAIDTSLATWSGFDRARFIHDRVLKFHPNHNITGINIIDDLLFFTDGFYEPKKINITRSIRGTTTDGNTHTQLYVTNELNELELAGDLDFGPNQTTISNDVLEEHVTVLRPAPKTPPTLDITTRDLGELQFTISNQTFTNSDGEPLEPSSTITMGLDSDGEVITTPPLSQTTFQQGDVIIASEENSLDSNISTFKLTFQEYLTVTTDGSTPESSDVPTDQASFTITTMDENVAPSNIEWKFQIELPKPKFELKFARFAYRYKYEDGEYSAFSPFSELAFDPGVFDYDSITGYNLGMVNTIQSLKIKDFIPYYTDRALDIVEVEILYKSTNNANVYTIKSIRKEKDPEWELFTPGPVSGVDTLGTGELELKSETIHRAIASNQLLRGFDNVPRLAKAQEITGSRILYGNFVQGFEITKPVSLSQVIESQAVGAQPRKSVKTLRDYKVGMVFGDKYGRETPVIESSSISGSAELGYSAISDDLNVPKTLCALSNQISVQQSWENPLSAEDDPLQDMTWMSYVKYYIKETSNEYYNLVLDRWYYARNQDNIWLSFPSADRNKVDLETYLILKKDHGEDIPVLEEARYKIIDIDNEAPDFIKIDHRPMGLQKMGFGNYVPPTTAGSSLNAAALFTDTTSNPNTQEPDKLTDPENKEIIIPKHIYKGDTDGAKSFLDNYGLTQRGQLYVRVVGRTVVLGGTDTAVQQIDSGDFVKVNHFYEDKSGDFRITIEKSFGQAANMVTAFENAGYDLNTGSATDSVNDLQYFLEFKEEVVENKPEFDGRFFVLIEKDFSIEKHVEKFSESSYAFVPFAEFKIGYIDSQQYNPALSGPYSRFENNGGLYGDASNPLVSGQGFNQADPTEAYKWWGWNTFPVDNTDIAGEVDTFGEQLKRDTPGVNFFSMGCASVNNNGNLKDDVFHNIVEGDTNRRFAAKQQTQNYWKKHREWHSNPSIEAAGYNIGQNTTGSGAHRIFLDGARALQYDLREFNEAGQGLAVLNEDETGNGNTLFFDGDIENFSVKYRNDDDLGGVSWYNYKPTALDKGHAEEGLGRMVISKQTVNGDTNDFGDSGGDILNYFTQETYFRFKFDTTDNSDPENFPNGKPYIYKIILKEEVDGVEVFRNIERTVKVRNYGRGLTGDGAENARSQTFSTIFDFGDGLTGGFCDDEDGDGNGVNNRSGTFGGENSNFGPDGLGFNSPQWRTQINDTYPGGNPPGSNPPVSQINVGGQTINEFVIRVRKNTDGSECFVQKFKKQRICETCDVSSGNSELSEHCARHSVRFEFRRVNADGSISKQGLIPEEFDPRGLAKHDGTMGNIVIEILKRSNEPEEVIVPEDDRSVWETEPKEDVGLDIYYEATHALPMKLQQGSALAFAPIGSKVGALNSSFEQIDIGDNVTVGGFEYINDGCIVKLIETDDTGATSLYATIGNSGILVNGYLTFTHKSGLVTRAKVEDFYAFTNINTPLTVSNVPTGYYKLETEVYNQPVKLGWHNCYSFGNGVESDRIRDDFNAPTIDNGVRVSTTIDNYGQENKASSLIFSGLYNTTSGVNDLNEFNMGEKIIKDLNPEYGSVQALKTRNTNVVVFCEDRILKVQANKEAVFLADGNPSIVATDRVLGTVSTFQGDYGISQNPESIAKDNFRYYFTDTQRGAVLRLSMDGLTPISDVGMKTWFRQNLRGKTKLLGTFDGVNDEYNLTIEPTPVVDGILSPTVSFSEATKGWVSFKSFSPDEGISVSGKYLTAKDSSIYEHYNEDNNTRNLFYGATELDEHSQSSLTVMFNEMPGVVKSFKTMNYEGSQARVIQNLEDNQYHNLTPKHGWWVEDLFTDLQEGKIIEFLDKENKWFNNIQGIQTDLDNLDTNEFTVQGLGIPTSVVDPEDVTPQTFTFTIQNDESNDPAGQSSSGSSGSGY